MNDYDPVKAMYVILGSCALAVLGFIGTALYSRFDGQSFPAAVLIGLLGALIGAIGGWLLFGLRRKP